MSASLIIVARIGLLVLFLIVIKAFAWPDIDPLMVFIQDGINKLYFMNAIMDMDTAFSLMKWTMSIEIIYLSYKLITAVVHFVASGSFGTDQEAGQKDTQT